VGYYDAFALVALIFAIGVNTLAVYLQKRKRIYDRFGKHALLIHSVVISFFWGVFVLSEFLLMRSDWITVAYPLAGVATMLLGLMVFCAALRQIGSGALGNSNFFGGEIKRLSGIYRYVNEPIYTSYVIWFLGLGLVTGRIGFYVIAAVAAIGLYGIESKVEEV